MLRSYYGAPISAAEVITEDIPGLIPRTIYNHYKLFNERKQAEENYNQKNIGIKLKI